MMWVVVYKWYIWPKHNNALVTNSSVKSRRGTIGIQLSTLEICSASFLFLPALYYGCFYSMLAVNSFNPELSSFNNSTLSWRIHPGQVWMAISRQWCVLEHTNRVDILRCCVDESNEYMCIYETKCFISIFICLSYCHHLMTQSAIFPHCNW